MLCISSIPYYHHYIIILFDVTRYDLVIADLMMPGMTGDALLEMIKADPRFASMPVICTFQYSLNIYHFFFHSFYYFY